MKKYEDIVVTDNLMKDVADGKDGAFDLLCSLTYKPLYSYIFSIVRNTQNAEDVLHDTYLAVGKSIHTYTPKAKPMAWLFTIARNLCYDSFRAHNCVLSTDDEQEVGELVDSHEEGCLNRWMLGELMTKLNEKERSVILLNVVSGYKFREIASILGEPLGTVLSCYRRGMKKMQEAMGGK